MATKAVESESPPNKKAKTANDDEEAASMM
jgi:hypothetical protein